MIVDAKLRRSRQIRGRYDDQIAEVKRNILTILNHEFRTPLTYMVAYSDMLNSDAESLTADELRSFLRGVNSGADRFRRLVENFIALVELETGEAAQNFSWRSGLITDVTPIILEVIEMCQLFAADRGVTILTDVPEQTPAFVGDREYLRAALAQLVENGIKFSDKPEAKVALRVTADDRHIRFAVQDWGRGIKAEEFDKIWNPFYQVNRSLHEDQGAGSGLAIVMGITELHGGQVELESQYGEGSTFTLVLPLATEADRARLNKRSGQPAAGR